MYQSSAIAISKNLSLTGINQLKINQSFKDLGVTSPIIYGCMGLGGGWNNEPVSAQDINQANHVIDTALENQINFFDHADIYTFGKAEKVFGEVLKQRPDLKDQLVIQSKCGIRFQDEHGPKRYDFSREWIAESVEGILTRLNIEHLPILLLHRPDPLMDPAELGECLNQLKQCGKVGAFGVSNMSPAQIILIEQHLDSRLLVNQLELSLCKLDWLEQGIKVNVSSSSHPSLPTGTIEFCQSKDIQLQAWGCLSQGLFSGRDVSDQPQHIQNTAHKVAELAAEYQVSKEAIVLAWLMRHPANVMPVIGTTNLARIKSCVEANSINLSRGHWYDLFESARGAELP